MKSFWRYRIGDHRVICRFEDNEMIILAVKVGHRREIYD
jgi:mRNA interferase RelE/StbE